MSLLKAIKRTTPGRWARLLACYALRAVSMSSVLLPIKKKRIVCISHRFPCEYSDSPMYIAEMLMKECPGEYELVWITDDLEKHSYLNSKGIKLVKYRSLKEFVYSNTAEVYIGNLFGPSFHVVNRKNKLIIETSHGVAYKSLLTNNTGAEKVGFPERASARLKINAADVCLSGSRITSEMVYRDELGYKGEISEHGLPRNDIFFSDSRLKRQKVFEAFGLQEEQKVLLVMPTWKQDQSIENMMLDYHALVTLLKREYGSDWVVLIRKHHLTKTDISDILAQYQDCMIDASDYPDPQELLCSADMLITDYSSVMWDFALRELPILIYAPDLEGYRSGRGFNVPPEDWGLYASDSQETLESIIKERSYEELCEASRRHLERFGSYETGHSTKDICDRIIAFCNHGDIKED